MRKVTLDRGDMAPRPQHGTNGPPQRTAIDYPSPPGPTPAAATVVISFGPYRGLTPEKAAELRGAPLPHSRPYFAAKARKARRKSR